VTRTHTAAIKHFTGYPNSQGVNRRSYLKTAGVTVTAGMFAGCSSSTDTESTDSDSETTYGTLATSVTDQPSDIGDFEALVVTLQGLWVKPAGGSETESMETESMEGEEMETEEMEEEGEGGDAGGRRYVEFEEPQEADLVQLQGANTQSLGETELETGDYQFLQLDVSDAAGTLADGSETSVDTPGNAPLKFNAEFEIRESERTHFVADFTPVQQGNGSYIIQPVASGTTVLYGDEEYTADDASTTTEGGEMETEETGETATDGGGQGNGNS